MAAEVTCNSGADGNYMSEANRAKLGLPILRESIKRVKVAGGEASKGKHVTKLSFPQLSKKAAEADTFDDFKTSLMKVWKTADDGNVSMFTKEGVKIYKEKDILITCKGLDFLLYAGMLARRRVAPTNIVYSLISSHYFPPYFLFKDRYRIPLVQYWGQWRPNMSIKASKKYL